MTARRPPRRAPGQRPSARPARSRARRRGPRSPRPPLAGTPETTGRSPRPGARRTRRLGRPAAAGRARGAAAAPPPPPPCPPALRAAVNRAPRCAAAGQRPPLSRLISSAVLRRTHRPVHGVVVLKLQPVAAAGTAIDGHAAVGRGLPWGPLF